MPALYSLHQSIGHLGIFVSGKVAKKEHEEFVLNMNLAGGDVEWLFMPNWSAKAEYRYMDLSSGGDTGLLGFQFGTRRHPQINVVRAGVNYHFNFGPSAQVLAKY